MHELAWLVERPEHQYLGFDSFNSLKSPHQSLRWTDHRNALRFARKVDAERFAQAFTDMNAITITEHMWIGD